MAATIVKEDLDDDVSSKQLDFGVPVEDDNWVSTLFILLFILCIPKLNMKELPTICKIKIC